MPYVDFDEVKQANSFEQVLSYLSLDKDLKRTKPNQFRGDCPFCEGSRSFYATLDAGDDKTGRFFCHDCKSGGDMIELVSRARGNPPRDTQGAKKAAEELMGTVTVPTTVPTTVTVPKEGPAPSKLLEIAARLQPEHELVQALGLAPETCTHFTAGFEPRGVLVGRLSIAIHDLNGKLVGFVGRALREDQEPILKFPKNLDPSAHIFNAHRVSPGEVFMVNDPLEVLLAYENGVQNVISFLHRASEVIDLPARKAS